MEIIILGILVMLMAKRGSPRRRWGPNMFRARNGVTELALATLADNDVITGALFAVSTNSFRALSFRGTWTIAGIASGQGPIHVGLAHGDYDAAEIEEWFEQTASIDRGNKIANEQASRLCRHVGTFSAVGSDETLNDGKPITTKMNWAIREGQTVNVWAHNQAGTTLTTGAIVKPSGWLTGRYT